MAMQAIQVRFLCATSTKGDRLKIWAEDKLIIEHARDYAWDTEAQAKDVARMYAEKYSFGESTGWGVLSNHDYVMTFGF